MFNIISLRNHLLGTIRLPCSPRSTPRHCTQSGVLLWGQQDYNGQINYVPQNTSPRDNQITSARSTSTHYTLLA